MKSTGIIRSIDPLGRLVLPKELRKTYGITPETPLEIFTDEDTILLRKYRPAGGCDICGDITDSCVLFKGKRICAACRKALAEL